MISRLTEAEIHVWKAYCTSQQELAKATISLPKGFDTDESRGFFNAVMFCVTSMMEVLSSEIVFYENILRLHETWRVCMGEQLHFAVFNPPAELKDRNYLLGYVKELRRQTDILDLWIWAKRKDVPIVPKET